MAASPKRRRRRPASTTSTQGPPSVYVDGNVVRKVEPAEEEDRADRRRSQRRAASATGWLSNATGSPLTSGRMVTICNLSLHGVGFTTTRPCQVGDRHWILITQGFMRLSTRVRIVSAQDRGDADGWNIGAEFF